MDLQKKIDEIKGKDKETISIQGPCLYVHEVEIDGIREKRRLYHSYLIKEKKEFYQVEVNIDKSKVYDDLEDAIDKLFSQRLIFPKN